MLATGGWLSLGSLVGFVTLFGITLRNSIMLVSHYQHLVDAEGAAVERGNRTARRGERLPSILMTALVTALGLLPLALGSGRAGARNRRPDGDHHRRRARDLDPAESADPADDPAALRPLWRCEPLRAAWLVGILNIHVLLFSLNAGDGIPPLTAAMADDAYDFTGTAVGE